MRDVQKLGWSRMAEVYRQLTGEYISRDTIRRRYWEAKRGIAGTQEILTEESNSRSMSFFLMKDVDGSRLRFAQGPPGYGIER